ERYQRLVGSDAILPLVGRRIPIIADEYSDPEKGTGAVKITPAHDFNDFEVGRRHGLPLVNVLDAAAHLNLAGNEAFLRDVPASGGPGSAARLPGPRALRGAQGGRAALGGGGPHGKGGAASAYGSARRPLRRRDRAVPHGSMVRRRQDAGRTGDRGGAR